MKDAPTNAAGVAGGGFNKPLPAGYPGGSGRSDAAGYFGELGRSFIDFGRTTGAGLVNSLTKNAVRPNGSVNAPLDETDASRTSGAAQAAFFTEGGGVNFQNPMVLAGIAAGVLGLVLLVRR